VVVFGNIVPDPPYADATAGYYPTTGYPRAGRGYTDFICLDGNDRPPDGDIDFNIAVGRSRLNAQIRFWSQGWETGSGVKATNFRNKLQVNDRLHIESIMYGGITECGGFVDVFYDSKEYLLHPARRRRRAAQRCSDRRTDGILLVGALLQLECDH
jgi:hypothetical protein